MLLTVAEYREFASTSLTDDALQVLLDAAEADITAAAGLTTSQTEYVSGGYGDVVLARPIGVVTTVTEYADTANATVIASNDYRISGHMLRRLLTGTNPSRWWRGLVKVVHDPADRLDERKRAQVALVSIDTALSTGVTSEKVGDWSASYGQNSRGSTLTEQREAVLASLSPLLVA